MNSCGLTVRLHVRRNGARFYRSISTSTTFSSSSVHRVCGSVALQFLKLFYAAGFQDVYGSGAEWSISSAL